MDADARVLVVTAGHIDHGKTALVRALSGVETDRLPEERARGISIDLGFAYWRPDPGMTIGFVDVPGHARYVRNMLAGVSAVDFALLVVAADDGVMPQSVEHVQILDLLGVARGIVAITKCDRSSRERIDAVLTQVQDLLAPTSLAAVPILEVSTVTGAGVTELGEALRAAGRAEAPRAATGHNFRLAIDRVFSVTGTGTVVTGTVLDGALESGARLVLSPRGLPARVRGLHSGGEPVTRIHAGERCALNLAGVEVAEAHRGDWLVVSEMHAPTSRIEVRLGVLRSKSLALKHHTPVHLHLGTADIAARVLIPGQAALPPGGESIVNLVLEHAACAASGDRFVLRDHSGRHLIGGGRVVDPFVAGERRNQAGRAPLSAALQLPDAAQALAALLAIAGHEVDTRRFERCFNLQAGAARELYRRAGAVLLGSAQTLALPAVRVDAIREQILEALKAFHRAHPDEGGMTSRALKENISVQISAAAFLALQRDASERRLIESTGSLVKLAGHTASFGRAERVLRQKLLAKLAERGAQPFTARELASDLSTSEPAMKALLYRMRSHGEVWRITETRFLLRRQVAALAARAAVLAQELAGKGFTAAQYRDAIGAGRNLVIQVLEFFDGIGVTRRNGDVRTMRDDYELVVGSAAPYQPREVAVGRSQQFGAK
jgi:selenocysteine-specific elongation factor